jgi:hypothetical protein
LKEAGAVSLDPFNRPETNVLHVEQVTNDLVANVFRWRKSQLAKGQTPDDNDINQFVINELPRTIGRYFQQNPNTKTWTTRPLSTNPSLTPNKIKSALVGSVRDASGFNPRTIQLRSMNSGSSVLLSKEEVTDNINRLTNNQPLTRKAQQLANTTTGGAVSLLTQQAQHQGIDPTPIQNSPQAKQQAQYAAVAPWATQRLNASGGNYLQQMLNLQRIVEAQNRAAVRETNNATVSSISGQIDTTKAFNALVGKESGGNYQALNTAGSGATGLGQVMPANIGPWTKEVLGRAMTQSEFRNNKAAQIRVVTYKFNQAIKSQLDAGFSPTESLRRAAAIWYSGDAKLVNSTKKEYYNGVAYPSIKEYADDILRRYNSY